MTEAVNQSKICTATIPMNGYFLMGAGSQYLRLTRLVQYTTSSWLKFIEAYIKKNQLPFFFFFNQHCGVIVVL